MKSFQTRKYHWLTKKITSPYTSEKKKQQPRSQGPGNEVVAMAAKDWNYLVY